MCYVLSSVHAPISKFLDFSFLKIYLENEREDVGERGKDILEEYIFWGKINVVTQLIFPPHIFMVLTINYRVHTKSFFAPCIKQVQPYYQTKYVH